MSYNPSRYFSMDICLQNGITIFYRLQCYYNHLLISCIDIYSIICRVCKKNLLNKLPIAKLLDCFPAFSASSITSVTGQGAHQRRERALGSDEGPNPK